MAVTVLRSTETLSSTVLVAEGFPEMFGSFVIMILLVALSSKVIVVSLSLAAVSVVLLSSTVKETSLSTAHFSAFNFRILFTFIFTITATTCPLCSSANAFSLIVVTLLRGLLFHLALAIT